MSKLTGKRALVTGGGSGIGLAVARLFLGEGAKVAITGRDEAKLRRAADELDGGDRLLYRGLRRGRAGAGARPRSGTSPSAGAASTSWSTTPAPTSRSGPSGS